MKVLKITVWILICGLVLLNGYFIINSLFHEKQTRPFDYLVVERPTLVVVFQEFECVTCIEKLKILNQLNHSLRTQGLIDVKGVIFSESGTDKKKIQKEFDFPIYITKDFSIFKRLNIDQTPLIIGLNSKRNIIYNELIPPGTIISIEYLKKGVVDRLYYFSRMNG